LRISEHYTFHIIPFWLFQFARVFLHHHLRHLFLSFVDDYALDATSASFHCHTGVEKHRETRISTRGQEEVPHKQEEDPRTNGGALPVEAGTQSGVSGASGEKDFASDCV